MPALYKTTGNGFPNASDNQIPLVFFTISFFFYKSCSTPWAFQNLEFIIFLLRIFKIIRRCILQIFRQSPAALFLFGVCSPPIHNPIVIGFFPSVYDGYRLLLASQSLLIYSHAQISVDALVNCCAASNLNVYRMITVVPSLESG